MTARLKILGRANIHQDGTAKGQHGAMMVQMESLQTHKVYFQVVCILRRYMIMDKALSQPHEQNDG